jgi:nitrate reductase cytochrome c-type subunit
MRHAGYAENVLSAAMKCIPGLIVTLFANYTLDKAAGPETPVKRFLCLQCHDITSQCSCLSAAKNALHGF